MSTDMGVLASAEGAGRAEVGEGGRLPTGENREFRRSHTAAEIGGAHCFYGAVLAPLRFAIPVTGVRLALLIVGQTTEQARDSWSR
jgi:hypothetical protein